jgi:hypothetical protein
MPKKDQITHELVCAIWWIGSNFRDSEIWDLGLADFFFLEFWKFSNDYKFLVKPLSGMNSPQLD